MSKERYEGSDSSRSEYSEGRIIEGKEREKMIDDLPESDEISSNVKNMQNEQKYRYEDEKHKSDEEDRIDEKEEKSIKKEKCVTNERDIDEEDMSTNEEEKIHEEDLKSNRRNIKDLSEEKSLGSCLSRSRSIERKRKKNRRSDSGESAKDNSEKRTTLYVSNIALDVTEGELRKLFEPFGDIEDCRIISNPITKESRGFGFISYRDDESIREAYRKLDGYRLAGKTIRVEKAKRNRPYGPTPGHYYGPPGASAKYGNRTSGRSGYQRYRSPFRGYGGRSDYYRSNYSRNQLDDRMRRRYNDRHDKSPRDDYEQGKQNRRSVSPYYSSKHNSRYTRHRGETSKKHKECNKYQRSRSRHRSPHTSRRSPYNNKTKAERRTNDDRYNSDQSHSPAYHRKRKRRSPIGGRRRSKERRNSSSNNVHHENGVHAEECRSKHGHNHDRRSGKEYNEKDGRHKSSRKHA